MTVDRTGPNAAIFCLLVLALAPGTIGCQDGAPAATPAGRDRGTTRPASTAAAQPAARTAPPQQPAQQPARAVNVTFDDLKFDIEKGAPYDPQKLTPKILDLVGTRIRIRGYIQPPSQQVLRSFVLVRDNKECCFGPKAALYDCIRVQLVGDQTAEYTPLPVSVEGTFSLNELKIGQQTWAIFFMHADSVK